MKENNMPSIDNKRRCFGEKPGQDKLADYHDNEWGTPLHDDQRLFEMLVLEGAQAGLAWETILKKREGYRHGFHDFAINRVASMTDNELEELLQCPEVIRNRLKIFGARRNAQVALRIQEEFGSLDRYFWNFVGGNPIINRWQNIKDVPTTTKESDALSKDLKKRGMTFVGSTIIYSFMQAVGMVNDHITDCFRYNRYN